MGKKCNSTVEKADGHYFSQEVRPTSTVLSHVDGVFPLHVVVMETALYPCGLPPQWPQPSLVTRKAPDKPQEKDTSKMSDKLSSTLSSSLDTNKI